MRGVPIAGPVAAGVGAALLFGIYVLAAGSLQGDAELTAFSSGIFDMDVARVVVDLTSAEPPLRASVHPLQKLLLAPLGRALRATVMAGRPPVDAARVLIAAFAALQALAVGVLTFQLSGSSREPGSSRDSGRSRTAGWLGGLVCGVSFSSVLAASVPESAVFAGFAGTLPLLLLGSRVTRRFSRGEALAWGGLAALAAGLTVTQIFPWLIAFGTRIARLPLGDDATRPGAQIALALVSGALLFAIGVAVQAAQYPGGEPISALKMVDTEFAFTRLGDLTRTPVQHLLRLVAPFLLYDFVAPFPAYSEFLVRDYGLTWWSLSLEAAGLERWSAAGLTLAAVVLAGVALSATRLRGAGVAFTAPLLAVASQFALHLIYGREYVLYSPHWHGILVAILVAAAWRGFPGWRRILAACVALLAAGMLAHNLAVMRVVYEEVEIGLAVGQRDASGAPLSPGR
jgi:hypothetical protein